MVRRLPEQPVTRASTGDGAHAEQGAQRLSAGETRTHSSTFPAMSSAPSGLREAGWLPASSGPKATGSPP